MSRLNWIDDWSERARSARYSSARLAKICGVSQSQLRRYFLQVFFRPAQEWLDELRLWEAVRLLVTGASVKAVAFSLGFFDTSHMCHQFSKYFGSSPSECAFRLRHVSLPQDGGDEFLITFERIPIWVAAERSLLSPIPHKRHRGTTVSGDAR
jgi:AraC-like DNA-binding protein